VKEKERRWRKKGEERRWRKIFNEKNLPVLPNFISSSRFIAYFSVQKRPPGFLKKKLASLYKAHYTTLKHSPRRFPSSFALTATVQHPRVAFVLSSRYGSSSNQNRCTSEPGLHCVTSSVDHRGYVVIYWGNKLGWRAWDYALCVGARSQFFKQRKC
jgi:hypothetical protein